MQTTYPGLDKSDEWQEKATGGRWSTGGMWSTGGRWSTGGVWSTGKTQTVACLLPYQSILTLVGIKYCFHIQLLTQC